MNPLSIKKVRIFFHGLVGLGCGIVKGQPDFLYLERANDALDEGVVVGGVIPGVLSANAHCS